MPPLIRCRGIELDPGVFSGCAYGSGEWRTLEGRFDCSTCNGSGYEGMTATLLPHADFGDPDCRGFIFGITDGNMGYLGCNQCTAVVQMLPAAELQKTLDDIDLAMDSSREMCPRCGKENLVIGFTSMLVYTCHECGEPIKLGPDPRPRP